MQRRSDRPVPPERRSDARLDARPSSRREPEPGIRRAPGRGAEPQARRVSRREPGPESRREPEPRGVSRRAPEPQPRMMPRPPRAGAQPEPRPRPEPGSEVRVRPGESGNAYHRYRQPPPKRRRRRGGRGLPGRLLAVLLVVALAAGAAGWMAERHRKELLRETLRQYPLAYRELIQRYAKERELEPCYIAAIIRAESSFQPDATSAVNAQGLMQILPETGEWLAGKFDETYTEGCLYDPETNIRYGCWYMGFLMERYDGDKACSSAAYHSGQGKVDSWLEDPAYSSDGRTLTVIPGENANTYVERVLNYYEKYKEIYGVDLTRHMDAADV